MTIIMLMSFFSAFHAMKSPFQFDEIVAFTTKSHRSYLL